MPGAAGSLLARLFRPRVHVAKTRILGRFTAPSQQLLAYSMNLRVRAEVAMILPLPVVPGSGDDALRFLSLEGEGALFDRLDALFEIEMLASRAKGGFRLPSRRPRLVVHDVGAFVASYVPTQDDFDRLDPRFRLPFRLSDAVPSYADYGFAVFQLKPGDVTVHPMAFTFETRAPGRLFFPTVHVHDGAMHPVARFDHALYYQAAEFPPSDAPPPPVLPDSYRGDTVSLFPPSFDAKGALSTELRVLRRMLVGKRPNEDQWIDVA